MKGATRMPRYKVSFGLDDGAHNWIEIVLPARTGIWKVLEFVSFYAARTDMFESVVIAHIA